MKIDQFESDDRRKDDGNRPWRKHATPLNRPPSNPDYPKTPFNRDEWMKSSKPMEEGSDQPVPGDTIRTPKLEGKVSKVEDGYVYFTTADGRNMRNTIENVTVVEKLADQDEEMFEDEEIDEVSTELLAKYKTAAGKDASAADKRGDFATGNKRFSGIVKATKKQFDNDAKKKTKEGTMGGINRSAPATDVSYEKVLDEVKALWQESQLNELSVGKMQAYKDAAKSNDSFKQRPLRKLAKSVQGVSVANQKINTKTGARKDDPDAGKGTNEDAAQNPFGDILSKQHKEAPPPDKKGGIQKIPSKNENFTIWYRSQIDKLRPVEWQVRDKAENIKLKGSSSSEKDAFNDAEDAIAKSQETSAASKTLTLNYNAAFARTFGGEGQTLWIEFDNGPTMNISEEPVEGYKRTIIRTPEHSRTAGAALLPVLTMSPTAANNIGLKSNSRYTLGPKIDLDSERGIYGFDLQWHSRIEKGIPVPLKEPSITVSESEKKVEEDCWDGYKQVGMKDKGGKQVPNCVPGTNEEYRGPWQGDSEKYTKAPKSSTQGKGNVRLSDMVQDTIREHGVKWAFEYYVHDHGMPPRQFQIFAGLTANKPAKAVDPMPAPQQPRPAAKAPEKQSWWKKLRDKLPFEE